MVGRGNDDWGSVPTDLRVSLWKSAMVDAKRAEADFVVRLEDRDSVRVAVNILRPASVGMTDFRLPGRRRPDSLTESALQGKIRSSSTIWKKNVSVYPAYVARWYSLQWMLPVSALLIFPA